MGLLENDPLQIVLSFIYTELNILHHYDTKVKRSMKTSTNVIGRLARTEFFNHFSIFFYSTDSFELNKFN